MTLFKTALKNLKNEFIMNFFTVIQMIFTIIVTIVMVSSILIRYQYYTPFSDYFKSNGIFCMFLSMSNSSLENSAPIQDMIKNDEIFNYLDNPTDILAVNNTWAYLIDDEQTSTSYSYNDNIIKNFTPELSEGRWLNTSDKADKIEVVVSQNDYDLNVGDTIELYCYNYPDSTIYSAEIVGKLKEGAKVPGGFERYSDDDDFNEFYIPYYYSIEEQPLMLFSSEYLANLDENIVQGLYASCIITYPDDYTEEQINAEQQKLSKYGGLFSVPLKELNSNSMKYLYKQVYNLLPVIIVLMVLTFVSSISSSSLSTRRRLKDYSIYYINGLQWRHCVVINLIQSVLLSLCSIVLAIVCLIIFNFTSYADNFKIIINQYTFLAVGVVVFLYLLVSMIMPIIIIGRSTPKQILTK